MSSLLPFFLVVIAVAFSKTVTASISVHDVDVDKLLNIIQQQRLNQDASSQSDDSDDSGDSSDVSDRGFPRNGNVGGDNIIDIISQVVNSRHNRQKINRERHNPREKWSNLDRAQNYGTPQRSNDVAYILEHLLNAGLKSAEPKRQLYTRTPKKRLTPNRLLGNARDKSTDDNALEDYSKIYVLLNPQAVQRSKYNKSAINELISKILSLSSIRDRQVNPKQRRYKGFAVNEAVGRRRSRRDSREIINQRRKSNSVYAPNDSMEDKPKRGRNGGGGGGHTAIPYIRHRGENIYERES